MKFPLSLPSSYHLPFPLFLLSSRISKQCSFFANVWKVKLEKSTKESQCLPFTFKKISKFKIKNKFEYKNSDFAEPQILKEWNLEPVSVFLSILMNDPQMTDSN